MQSLSRQVVKVNELVDELIVDNITKNNVTKIGIDTNVLARYILQDDERQANIANNFLESLNAHKQGVITCIILVELVWLLKQGYKQRKEMIVQVLSMLLTIDTLNIENKEQVLNALDIYKSSSADFSDALIAMLNHDSGCVFTVTFDKGAVKKTGIKLLG